MATHAALYTPRPDGLYATTYLHFDGHPSVVLPALRDTDAHAIQNTPYIRSLMTDGTYETMGRDDLKPHDPVAVPHVPAWADYAYVYSRTSEQWEQVPA